MIQFENDRNVIVRENATQDRVTINSLSIWFYTIILIIIILYEPHREANYNNADLGEIPHLFSYLNITVIITIAYGQYRNINL